MPVQLPVNRYGTGYCPGIVGRGFLFPRVVKAVPLDGVAESTRNSRFGQKRGTGVPQRSPIKERLQVPHLPGKEQNSRPV